MMRGGAATFWIVFAAAVGVFSVWPGYSFVEGDEAIISVAFSHAADRVAECRQLTQEELDKLPPNMRTVNDCPRARHPLRIELWSNDRLLYSETLQPSGIWSDGKANVYQRLRVRAGEHRLQVRMEDSGDANGFSYAYSETMTIAPGRNVVVRFDGRQFVIQ